MRSQLIKNLYYASLGKVSIVVYLWQKFVCSSGNEGAFLNVGCGPKYVSGMVNIDGNIFRKKDLWLDVILGLPFPDNSIQGIYASHVIEHFNISKVRTFLSECYRVLRPGGVLRLVVPSLEYAIKAYSALDSSALPEWPEKFASIGGRFNNFMLCANQHLLMFDYTFLHELLLDAGFKSICKQSAHASICFDGGHLKFESDPSLKDKSIYVESAK